MSSENVIVNESDLEWDEVQNGDQTLMKRKKLGNAVAGSKLGCSLYEIPAGKRSWPMHYHCANEESIYVLSGEGRLRLRDREVPLRAGDYASFPATPDGAHQIVNDSSEPLRLLFLSTMLDPDISIYPESNKVGLFAGRAPGGAAKEGVQELNTFLDRDAVVDYWKDEG